MKLRGNGPRHLAAYDPDRLTREEAALVAARVAGCTCEPTIEIRGIHAIIRHDGWCILVRPGDVN